MRNVSAGVRCGDMIALLNDALSEGAIRRGVEVDQVAFELIAPIL